MQQDEEYRVFQSKLIPTVDPKQVIGVRTPVLRKLAKELMKQEGAEKFLTKLPHEYYEENQLHGFMIGEIKDFDTCVAETERFLPYVDNWSTCDQMPPKCFKKHREELLEYIKKWMSSDQIYTVRFGIGMLMRLYLDDAFRPEYLDMVAAVQSEEYYVKMMVAWYFATALAKQYEATIPYIEEHRLPVWTHNKTIQKAVESFRITPEQKEYLRTLKRKNGPQ